MSVGTEWNSPWLNRCYWVMGHLDEFQLNTTEALVLSLIAFFNETGQPVTLEGLSARCFITMEELDELLFGLENRGYLKIRALRGEMVYAAGRKNHQRRTAAGIPAGIWTHLFRRGNGEGHVHG